jgi:hypothetical protein
MQVKTLQFSSRKPANLLCSLKEAKEPGSGARMFSMRITFALWLANLGIANCRLPICLAIDDATCPCYYWQLAIENWKLALISPRMPFP